MGEQHEILALPLRGGTILPGEIAARADVEELAQALDGEVLLRRIDELEPHRLPSLAKKAVARFRISRSWRSTSFSRRSRFSSAAMSSWRSGGGSSISRSRRPSIQERSVDSPIPRSEAISRREQPLVWASRTASARNSGVKCFFGSGIGDLLLHGKELSTSPRQVHLFLCPGRGQCTLGGQPSPGEQLVRVHPHSGGQPQRWSTAFISRIISF